MPISNTPSPLSNIIAAKTYNAAWFSGSTKELQITAAIAAALADGALYVYVPANMLPYTASSVTFNNAVKMLREGGVSGTLEVQAYGAACDGVTDDSPAVQATINACIAQNPPWMMTVSGRCRLGSSVNIDRVVDGPTNDHYFRIVGIGGGGFRVTTAISMFSSSFAYTTVPVTQLILFDGIMFDCTDNSLAAYVLNDARFLRIQFNVCDFVKIKLLTATTVYTQSIYVYDCNIRRWTGTFFNSAYISFDIRFLGNIVEAGQAYLNIASPVGCEVDDTIEGMSGTAILYSAAQGLDIRGYFENNDIDIDGRVGTSYGVNIHGSNFSHLPAGAYAPSSPESILWGQCFACESKGNSSNYKLHKLLTTSEVEINDFASTTITNYQGKSAIIRGQIASDGSITTGSGFTITKGVAGLYTINITTTYRSAPAFAATALDSLGQCVAVMGTPAASSIAVSIRNAANTLVDCAFCFEIVGI